MEEVMGLGVVVKGQEHPIAKLRRAEDRLT